MSRFRAGAPGLHRQTALAVAAFLGVSGLLTTPSSAADPTPAVTAEDKAATAIASPSAAPKVELPYKLLTKPSQDAYSAQNPAITVDAAAPAKAAAPAPAPPAPAQAIKAEPATAPTPAENAQAVPAPKKPAPPEITLNIDIDLTRQKMTLTEYGKVVGSWAISSGAAGYRSPTGTFRPVWSSKMWYSKQYDNAPMPHAVFFNGGVAMHATQSVSRLGSPASHGCIRQSPANAEKTYKLVAKHGNSHVKIVVHGKPKDDEPRIARRDRNRDNDGAATRYASRESRDERAQYGMRRVIMVDSYGNRRIAEIPANDPRLAAYHTRSYNGSYYGGDRNRW